MPQGRQRIGHPNHRRPTAARGMGARRTCWQRCQPQPGSAREAGKGPREIADRRKTLKKRGAPVADAGLVHFGPFPGDGRRKRFVRSPALRRNDRPPFAVPPFRLRAVLQTERRLAWLPGCYQETDFLTRRLPVSKIGEARKDSVSRRPPPQRMLFFMTALGLMMPMALTVVLGAAALLAAMGDPGGRRPFAGLGSPWPWSGPWIWSLWSWPKASIGWPIKATTRASARGARRISLLGAGSLIDRRHTAGGRIRRQWRTA